MVLTLKQKVDICRGLEKGENRKLIMDEYGIGSSTIYDIKAQSEKLHDFVKDTDTPKAAEKRHTVKVDQTVRLKEGERRQPL